MAKQTIKITEAILHKMVAESLKRALNENINETSLEYVRDAYVQALKNAQKAEADGNIILAKKYRAQAENFKTQGADKFNNEFGIDDEDAHFKLHPNNINYDPGIMGGGLNIGLKDKNKGGNIDSVIGTGMNGEPVQREFGQTNLSKGHLNRANKGINRLSSLVHQDNNALNETVSKIVNQVLKEYFKK